MQHADAQGGRVGLLDSIKKSFASLPTTATHVSQFRALHGHMKAASQPVKQRFYQSEVLLRRTIPVLIVTLLLLVAGARTSSLLNDSVEIDQKSRDTLAHIAEITSLRLNLNPSLESSLVSPTLSGVLLQDALPTGAEDDGRSAFLLSAVGRVVAQSQSNHSFKGINLNRLTGGDVALTTKGSEAGVRDILLDGNIRSLATYRALGNQNGIPLGGLLMVQDKTHAFANWWQAVRLNIVLFLALGSVMLVIVYAYFKQGERARVADQLFLEINARFDTAMSRGHCGLWDWDLARGRIVWSRSMYEMLGMDPRDRVMGFGELSSLMHPEDEDLKQLADDLLTNPKLQFDHRFRMMHSNGAWIWMRIRAELVNYKGLEPHLIGIAVDISEQEALKQKNRDADIRLRDAIENISEAFVLWDSKKQLVMCNSKYQQLYNLPSSSIVSGTPHEEVMQNSRKPKMRSKIPTDRRFEKGTKTYEAQIEDGRWLQVSERRTRDGGFVSIGTDITQIKRNEEKLMDSEQRLMATIKDLRSSQHKLEYQAQQLVELAEEYNDQKKKAEAGNRSKSEFLANISHELRTPLNAIIGFSDIMRSNMFGPMGSEKYDEYADDIHHSGSFLLGVINDVLDMSKIEAGRFQLSPETVHLDELLDETMRIISMQAEESKITVNHKIPDSLVLDADRRAVKQILLNLLSNAVKFTPEDGRIDVTAKALKHSVNIVIRDNGIGISREAIQRIGQPFEQVQDQFTKNHKGSGLGLAIARSLTMLHGGTLKIRSAPGEGTLVAVRLPFECKTAECDEINDEAAKAA